MLSKHGTLESAILSTLWKMEKEGIYNEHVEQQHYDLSLLSNDQYGIRKGASL